jgi:hypothetical protein
MTSALYCGRQDALMMRATSGNPTGNDFAAFRDKSLQETIVPVIYLVYFILAKSAVPFAAFVGSTLQCPLHIIFFSSKNVHHKLRRLRPP